MQDTSLRAAVLALSIGLPMVGCGGSKPGDSATTPRPESLPLGGIVGQNIVVAPVQSMRIAPELGAWGAATDTRKSLARLDSLIADTLRSRVGNQQWVFADGLVRAAANNPTYAIDPRMLAANPLRAPGLKIADRLPEPIASQLRTMIALQNDVRLVLIPVELRIDRADASLGRPILRLVLVDPRASVVRWIGEARGDDARASTTDLPAIIAARFADLFVAR